MRRQKEPTCFLKITLWGFVLVYSLVVIYPMFWLIAGSLKTNVELFTNIFGFPTEPQWGNYKDAWNLGIQNYYVNSIVVTAISVGIILTISSLAAYGFARFHFPGDKFFFLLLLSGMMIPPHAVLIPLYLLLRNIHLFNTRWALILPYVAFGLPLSTLIFRAYFLSFPHELEDAARIDGCSSLGTLIRVILPLNKGTVSAVGIIQTIFWWNEFLFALVFIEDDKLKTLPVGLLNLQGQYLNNWVGMLAAISIATIPIILAYVILQEQFIRGMSEGALKG